MPPFPGTSIRVGARGENVRQIQQCLNRVAARHPAIQRLTEDGVFGPLTLGSVTTFQRIFGLSPDGIVGPLTWAALTRECGSASVAQATTRSASATQVATDSEPSTQANAASESFAVQVMANVEPPLHPLPQAINNTEPPAVSVIASHIGIQPSGTKNMLLFLLMTNVLVNRN